MKGVGVAAAAMLVAASMAPGADVGGFADSRLLNPSYNLLTGDQMGVFRDLWTASGAEIRLADTVTEAYLDTVDVFITSQIGFAPPSADEVQAMATWVEDGGVLIVTADCA